MNGKKRISSFLLALTMLLRLMPATAGAETTTHSNHPVCGASCGHTGTHEAVEWKALSQDSFTGGEDGKPQADSGISLSWDEESYILEKGSYYLAENITVDKEIRISVLDDTVNLCLNGHTLASQAAENGCSVFLGHGTLNLCDCGIGGSIRSGAKNLLDVNYKTSVAFLYGGTLQASGEHNVLVNGTLTLDGAVLKTGTECAIHAQSSSTVAIKSGSIEGGGRDGAEIFTTQFTMTGGTITHTGSGEALAFASNGSGRVSGGTISSKTGCGIGLGQNSITLSGSPAVTGGKADIAVNYSSLIIVEDGLTGSYTVFQENWNHPNHRYEITEAKPITFTDKANKDYSGLFAPAASMTGIAVRNIGEGENQQVQLYRPHVWAKSWKTTATHHWHECTTPESECIITDYATCGEAGAAYGAHSWGDYETNSDQHRKTCAVCDYGETWAPHSFDNSNYCDQCGYARAVALTGTVTVTGMPKLGVPLTASVTGAPEGVTLKYAWTAAGSGTVLGTDVTYTPTADEVGKVLTVTVTAEDTRYTGSLSAVTAAVAKGDQAAPSRDLFNITDTDEGQSNGAISINSDVDKLEYRLKPADGSDPAYTDAPASLTSLAAGFYEFRYKETDIYEPSPATELEVRALTPQAKKLTIDKNIVHGRVTAVRDAVNPGDKVTLTVKPETGYELTTIAANYNDGADKTITPTADPADSTRYIFKMPEADVHVSAVFTAIVYTIDYQWAGVANGSFTVEDASITLAAAVRDGFVLTGWSFTENGAALTNVTAADLISKAVGGTVPLYPIWTESSSGHSHAWSSEWTASNSHHWHECGANDCPITQSSQKDGYAAHVYDNDQDTTCNICGYTRTVTPPEPGGETKGEGEVTEGTPQVSVDTNVLKELAGTPAAGQTITVKLTVEKKESPEDKDAIDAIISGKKDDVLYLDLSLLKISRSHDGTTSEALLNNTGDRVLEIEVPYSFTGKKDVTVYRKHGSEEPKVLTRRAAKPAADVMTDGSFFADSRNGKIYIYASKFSTYAIGYTQSSGETPPSTGSSGGGADSPATYPPTVDTTEHGTVTVSPRNPGQGETVTVTLTPDDGYQIAGVTVTDRNGKLVAVTGSGNGTYTFIQPGGRVTIHAVFTKMTDGFKNCPRDSTCPIWPYTDADTREWYHDGVHYCIENELMVGSESHTFSPSGDTSRAMIATILWRMEGSPVVNYILPFDDVAEGVWYTEAIRWAAASGVVGGYGNGKFGPGNPVAREQLAAMLYRYKQYKGGGFTGTWMFPLNYADADLVSSWAREPMCWAAMNGIITGIGNDQLDPQGKATRAQAAAMIMRFCQLK